jgi:hypothetical protein
MDLGRPVDVDPRRGLAYLSPDPKAEEQTSGIADMAMSLVPGLGEAQALRDFERARRSGSKLGMVLGAAGVIPGVKIAREGAGEASKLAKALRKGAKLKAAEREASFDAKTGAPVLLGRSASEQAALDAATKQHLEAAALRKQAGGAPFPHLATRYPEVGAPTWELKNPSNPKLGAYQAKGPSGESAAFMQERQALNDEMAAQGFPRYFNPDERHLADVSHYPTGERTLDVAKPKKAATAEKWRSMVQTPEAEARVDEAIRLADEVGGGDRWYHTGQMQKAYQKALGEGPGAERYGTDFADRMAATTGGADPGDNWLMSQYANFQAGKGLPAAEYAREIPSPVGGRYVSGNMKMANEVASGAKPLTAAGHPKRFNFSRNFKGDTAPSTIDERMTGLQMPTMVNTKGKTVDLAAPPGDSYFAFEEMLNKRGGSEAQDRAWLGHKLMQDLQAGVPRDKLEKGKPMIEWLNESIHRTSKLTGLSPDEVVQGWAKRTTPAYGIAAAGTAGALAAALRNKDQQQTL